MVQKYEKKNEVPKLSADFYTFRNARIYDSPGPYREVHPDAFCALLDEELVERLLAFVADV